MANNQSSVRFDHREIAVIFSLFIFVSLLMFTVGILVGKGLAQARLDAANGHGGGATVAEQGEHGEEAGGHEAPQHANLGTSITTGHESEHGAEAAHDNGHGAKAEAHGEAAGHGETAAKTAHHEVPKDAHGAASVIEEDDDHKESGHKTASAAGHGGGHEEKAAPAVDESSWGEPKADLELVPKHAKHARGGVQDFPKSKETDALLKNPRIAGLFESGSGGGGGNAHSIERSTASVPNKIPKSSPKGKYTVQVGSYPNQREALERVEALKKLGFPYAYFSAKDLEDKNTWYRVWLGYFPDASSAKAGGEILQARGEVNSYLVRKSDSNH